MIDTQQQYINLNIRGEISNINNCGAGTLGQEKRYMHINVHTLTHIYIKRLTVHNIHIHAVTLAIGIAPTRYNEDMPWLASSRRVMM